MIKGLNVFILGTMCVKKYLLEGGGWRVVGVGGKFFDLCKRGVQTMVVCNS